MRDGIRRVVREVGRWATGTVVVVTLAGVPLATRCERIFDRKDPGAFVLDEVAGILVTALVFRVENVLTLIWVFAHTRAFDILKPPPVRRLEGLPKGWGILADDVCASLYAAALLHLLRLALPRLFGLTA